jgi:hypothetical protein
MMEGREKGLGWERGTHGEGRQPIGLLLDPFLREHGCGGRDSHFLRRREKNEDGRSQRAALRMRMSSRYFTASGKGLVRWMACDLSTGQDRAGQGRAGQVDVDGSAAASVD